MYLINIVDTTWKFGRKFNAEVRL